MVGGVEMNAQLNPSMRKTMASGAGAGFVGYELAFQQSPQIQGKGRSARVVFAASKRAANHMRPCGRIICGGAKAVQTSAAKGGLPADYICANFATCTAHNPSANIVSAAIIARLPTNPILRNQAQKTTHSVGDKLSPTGIVELTTTNKTITNR
jgi:hypothetical protein